MINEKRVRLLQKGKDKTGPVIYWMSRDQRAEDNWALLFARQQSEKLKSPLVVVFTLATKFLEAGLRQYDFMLKGLQATSHALASKNIPFHILTGAPEKTLPEFLKQIGASILVSDFDPLKIKRIWKRDVAKAIDIPFYEVDAHNIVPAFYVSQKKEFAAHTIRPKIHKLLPEFMDEFPPLKKMKNNSLAAETDFQKIFSRFEVDGSILPLNNFAAGSEAANQTLNRFLKQNLPRYNLERNDPNAGAVSNLSPYLHFGQLSAQRAALLAQQFFPNDENARAFLEELIVRRELSDNFCYYNQNYDSFEGFDDWAKKTLELHRKDEREIVYSLQQFENAKTHEALWNAAQTQLVSEGKIHGYMRMYWAKKILEWSEAPEEALRISIYLNDKYALDGRDANGYVGCAWSVGGVHDRAWSERAVFGKIRYMNFNGCKRKFNVEKYIATYLR